MTMKSKFNYLSQSTIPLMNKKDCLIVYLSYNSTFSNYKKEKIK